MPEYLDPKFGLTDHADLLMVAVVTPEGQIPDAALLDKAQAITVQRCSAGKVLCGLGLLCGLHVEHADLGGNGIAQADIFEVVCDSDCLLPIEDNPLKVDRQ